MVWDSGVEHEDRCNVDSLGFVVGEESRSRLGTELDERRFSVKIQIEHFVGKLLPNTVFPVIHQKQGEAGIIETTTCAVLAF